MKVIFFGKNLEYLREKRGIKKNETKEIIGFERTTWQGYESGKSYPKLEDFLKIAEFFHIGLESLAYVDLASKEYPKENTNPILITDFETNILEQLKIRIEELKERVVSEVEGKELYKKLWKECSEK